MGSEENASGWTGDPPLPGTIDPGTFQITLHPTTAAFCPFGGGLCKNALIGDCAKNFSGLHECRIFYEKLYSR